MDISDARSAIAEASGWLDEAIEWLTCDDAPEGVIYPVMRNRLIEIRELLQNVECDDFKRDTTSVDFVESDLDDRACALL